MLSEDDICTPEAMLAFYKRLYPFKSLFAWLNHQHGPSQLFTNREFALTLVGDVYIRYNSYSNAEDMKTQIIRYNPARFEIGAVYNARPRDKKSIRHGMLQPSQRELVFDIDMTDYDSIRTCCSGKGICKRCWGFIAAAVDILDHALRDQFGFRHLLWVYSGRRGIHCWVSDKEAMGLTDEQRKAMMGWLEVIKGGTDMTKKVNVRASIRSGLHPSLQDAVEKLKHLFTDLILTDQDCFIVEEQWKTLLELIPDRAIIDTLRSKWEKDSARSSAEKWDDLRYEIRKKTQSGRDGSKTSNSLLSALEDIILQYTYPRLDSEVTKHRNHLLKAPFCVHPATGRVCVPVDPRKVHEFDPEKVPTVGGLLKELPVRKAENPEDKMEVDDGEEGTILKGQDWESTSLKPYVDMLDKHASGLMDEFRKIKRETNEASMDF